MVKLASFNASVPASHDRHRRGLLAKVHVAAKALGLAKEDYRPILERITGHATAANCTNAQLGDVVREFERLGFSSRGRRSGGSPIRAQADHLVARKARALWISLGQIGAINDSSETALEAFGRRQLGVDRLQWADQSQGYLLIEALKAIAERHGWEQGGLGRMTADQRVWTLRDRLIGVLLAKLEALDLTAPASFADRRPWPVVEQDACIRQLAARLRSIVREGLD